MFFPTIFGIPRYDLKINILRSRAYQTNDLDNEITDVVGIRIISYLESDVDNIDVVPANWSKVNV